MKTLYTFALGIVSFALGLLSCDNNVGYNEVVTDCAVAAYYTPSQASVRHIKGGKSSLFFTTDTTYEKVLLDTHATSYRDKKG